MSAQQTKPKARQHSHELEIAATPEELWNAITDANELVNWFPLQAAVKPGKGGTITYGWGDLSGDCRIEEWTPPRHLRTSWLAHGAPGGETSGPVVVDWYLDGREGGTRLRLVHSGFGTDASWDDEYEGTRRGWDFELASLKHYLEHHRGTRRHAFWLRREVSDKASEIWPRLVSPVGLFRVENAASLRVGDKVSAQLPGGDRIEGLLLQNEPPHEFGFTADNLNNGLLRIGFENCFGKFEAHLWVALWGMPAGQREALQARLDKALDEAVA